MAFKIPAELKAKWLEALRSGNYQQGRYALELSDGDENKSYCCLGVLQKVVDGDVQRTDAGEPFGLPTVEWYKKNGIHSDDWNQMSLADNEPCTLTLPYGLSGIYVNAERSLSSLNDELPDVGGKTFAEIADLIEQKAEAV